MENRAPILTARYVDKADHFRKECGSWLTTLQRIGQAFLQGGSQCWKVLAHLNLRDG